MSATSSGRFLAHFTVLFCQQIVTKLPNINEYRQNVQLKKLE